jgi:type I restriction enzyme S subunit
MSFPKYPEYKKSGVDWLGELPSHWDVVPLKAGFELQKRPPNENSGIVTAFRDGQVTLRSNRRTDGFTEAIQEIGYQGIEPNDLVIHAMDAFAGAIGVSDSKGKSSPVYSVCKPYDGFLSDYYGLTLRHISLSGYITSLAKGIRERSTDFRWSDAKKIPVPKPPFDEQKIIIKFLDQETAKIDSLISEQEKLIELLKEKRQAVISHAVTKGLDPNVKMKDSGVEWLGNIPEHWEVRKGSAVGYLFGSEQILEEHILNEGTVPFLKVSSMSQHSFEIESWDWFINESLVKNLKLRSEYVVFPKRGAAIFLNKVNIVKKPSVIDPNLMGWQMYDCANPEFMGYTLKARKLDELADVSTV